MVGAASPTLQTTRLALVATKCPTCGVVGLYSGSTLLAKVNLKVLSSGKTVQVDGLATSRV